MCLALDAWEGHCMRCELMHEDEHDVQGCNTFTISPDCANQLFQEPLTWQVADQFERDAAALGAT